MKAVFCWAVFGKREAGKEKVLYGRHAAGKRKHSVRAERQFGRRVFWSRFFIKKRLMIFIMSL